MSKIYQFATIAVLSLSIIGLFGVGITHAQSAQKQIQLDGLVGPGDRGEQVRQIQQLLAQHTNLYPEKLVTGYYGDLTAQAISRLQAEAGLPQVGRVGQETLNYLLSVSDLPGTNDGGGNPEASSGSCDSAVFRQGETKQVSVGSNSVEVTFLGRSGDLYVFSFPRESKRLTGRGDTTTHDGETFRLANIERVDVPGPDNYTVVTVDHECEEGSEDRSFCEDGEVKKRWTQTGELPQCGQYYNGQSCNVPDQDNGDVGWVGGEVPDCGESSRYVTSEGCSVGGSGSDLESCSFVGSTEVRTQKCSCESSGEPTAQLDLLGLSSNRVDTGEQFTVSAERSSDPQGDRLEYAWDIDTPRGSAEEDFSDRSRLVTSFDNPGTATFAVTVRDSNGNTDTESISVQILSEEQPESCDGISLREDSTKQINTGGGSVSVRFLGRNGDTNVLSFDGNREMLAGEGDTATHNGETFRLANIERVDTDSFRADDFYVLTIVHKCDDEDNQPPEASDDDYAVTAGKVLEVGAAEGVLANDTDPDGDSLRLVDDGDGIDQISNFKGASAEFNSDGSFFVQVEDGYEGDTVDYMYTVTDGEDSDRGQITVDVRNDEDNQPPEASNDSFTTQENQSLTISADDLLANDSNPGGGDLIVDGMSFPGASNGRWSVVDYEDIGDGVYRINSVEYTPEPGYTGTWTFDYQAQDTRDKESADTASVTVQVQETDDQPPVARLSVNPSQTVDIGEAFTVTAEGSSDPDEDELEYRWDVNTPNGSSVSGGFSDLSELPLSFNTPGTATFELTVRDGNSSTDTASIDVEIQEKNEQVSDAELIQRYLRQDINEFPAEDITLGDVNQNGSINAIDAQVIQRYANGQTDLSFRQKAAADVDGDGQISGN
jgi:hypothetical protein